ncbi:hypothetical protein CVT25_015558 [Psilocybe cyanescens]|uniref:C2H2-type domain-containing protein n=1 Tax=Psilocybe cyanescens TaxID=93625 RepID=A0A409WHL5_PSICY|nr:hypothetical protein CVT25_015558 [Psilocybe cyanescens]
MPIENTCFSCSKSFETVAGLRSHCRAKRHAAPFACDDCNRTFASSVALESHMNSPRHVDAYFSSADESSDDSEESDDSEDEPYCDSCNRFFKDTFSLNQHLAFSEKHHWCFECSRDFSSETSLGQHQESLAHRGRDFKCPFCDSMFKSPSGIALHIESGCHKVTRHQVTAAVHKMKVVPNISIKRIGGSSAASNTVRTFIASEASWNGTSYACFLCNKKCKTLAGLNSHLNSAAHDEEEFRCPKCKAEFKLISGFVQHLESRSCGLAKNEQVESYFNDLSGQFSRLLKL